MPVTRSMAKAVDCGAPVASTSTAPAASRSNRNGVDKSSKKATATVAQPKAKSSKSTKVIPGKRFLRPEKSVILEEVEEENEDEGDQMQLETAQDFDLLKQVARFGKQFLDDNSNIKKGMDSVSSGIASTQIARNELMKQYEAAVAKFKVQVQSNSVPTTSKTSESTNRPSYSIKRKQYFDDEDDEHSPSTRNTKQAHPVNPAEGLLNETWTIPHPKTTVSFNFMDLNLTEVKAVEKSTLTPSASEFFEITVVPQERADMIQSNDSSQYSDPAKDLPTTPMSEINPTKDPFTTPNAKGMINPVISSGNGTFVLCDDRKDEVVSLVRTTLILSTEDLINPVISSSNDVTDCEFASCDEMEVEDEVIGTTSTASTKDLINPVISSGHGTVVCDDTEDEVIGTTLSVSISSPLSTTFLSMETHNYNITLYEEFDEENKHRMNKKVPQWARNDDNLKRELLLMGPTLYQKFNFQIVTRREPTFPVQRPNFKLFPDAYVQKPIRK